MKWKGNLSFYFKLPYLTTEAFEEVFYKQWKEKGRKQQDRKKMLTDGNRFEFFILDQLQSFTYLPNGMKELDGTE